MAFRKHPYSAKTKFRKLWKWEKDEEEFYKSHCKGKTIHVCCGQSKFGDIRIDRDVSLKPDIVADYRHIPLKTRCADSVICDPPWGKKERIDLGVMNWLTELRRISKSRILIIHNTLFKIKAWKLMEAYAVNSKGLFWKIFQIHEPHTLPLEIKKKEIA